MSNQIAVGQCSTEEDLDIEWSFASGYDPTGKTLEVLVRERASAAIKTTLTVGSGLTIVGAAVRAKVAKATMAAWARMEYTADLVDKTGGTPKRLVPTRITFDEPGKLVGGVTGNAFQVTAAGNSFVVTAVGGAKGDPGGEALIKPTWADLAALSGLQNGQRGLVPLTDVGTHTDPVVGGTVPNAGTYSWSPSPAGWRRVDDYHDVRAVADEVSSARGAEPTLSGRLLGMDAAQRKPLPPRISELTLKGGLWSLVEDLLAIDRLGRLRAPDFVRGDDEPIIIKNGRAVLIADRAGEPLIWFDLATRSVRTVDGTTVAMGRGGYLHAVESERGDLISAIGSDGRHYAPASARAPAVGARPVDDGGGARHQLYLADGARCRRVTCASVDCFGGEWVAPGLVRYGRADGAVGLARAPVAAHDDLAAAAEIAMIVLHGQSLALGSNSYAPSTPVLLAYPPSPRVLMFNGGLRTAGTSYVPANFTSLIPAAEALSAGLGETGLVAAGFGLTRDVPRDMLVASSGVGGTAYAGLKKGTLPWDVMLYGVTRGKALADGAAKPFSVPAFIWRQGENDEDKSAATYLGYLDELLADLTSDINAITGQSVGPTLFLQQINRVDAGGVTYGPAQAQFTAGTARARMVLVAPQYIAEFGDAYHMLNASYQWMGSYAAKAIRRTVYEGRKFLPLYPMSATRSGRVVSVKFNVPSGRLALDTTWVSDPGKYGVVYTDSTASAFVERVELHPTLGDTLLVTLSAVPSGSAPKISFAWRKAGTETAQGRTTGLRTCIRDTDPEACPATGRPLHNYCVASEIEVL